MELCRLVYVYIDNDYTYMYIYIECIGCLDMFVVFCLSVCILSTAPVSPH